MLLLLPSAAAARDAAATFEELSRSGALTTGDEVHVTRTDGLRITDAVERLTAEALILQRARSAHEREIQRIDLADSIQEGVWLGALAGAAAGLVTGRVACNVPDSECETISRVVVGVPAAVAGALLGALFDAARHRTVLARPTRP